MVPAIYPTGGEKQLIRVLTGREVPRGGLPADIGVICQNVATAHAVHAAVVLGRPLLSRLVTVAGRGTRQPRNLLARIGTPIAELIRQCGGYSGEEERLIQGGPLMGHTLTTDAVPLLKTSNCILVAGRGELGVPRATRPCIRCGYCADVCPARLLPQQLHWFGRAGQWPKVAEYRVTDCIECACCDLVCPSHIPLTRQFRDFKDKLAELEAERQAAEHARMRYEARRERKLQEQRELAEQSRRRKESLGKVATPEIRRAVERAKAKRSRNPDEI
jgi:electron transport complex protein RnfC